jgi:hypothetical protein
MVMSEVSFFLLLYCLKILIFERFLCIYRDHYLYSLLLIRNAANIRNLPTACTRCCPDYPLLRAKTGFQRQNITQ